MDDLERTRRAAPHRLATLLLVAVLAVVAVVATACGGGGGGGDDAQDPPSSEVPSDGFEPFTVDHRYGSTEIEAVPQRIVSLDPQWTDVLLAFGVTPTAHITHTTADREFPWQEGLLGDSQSLVTTSELPFEAVGALKPDLILVTFAAEEQGDFDLLSRAGPTVAALSGAEIEDWRDMVTLAGRFLGRPDDAAALIAEVDGQVSALADELPGLEGKTFAFANYLAGDGIWVLVDPDDGANRLFGDLGLDLAPGIVASGADATGRVEISLEQIDLLDGDVLVMLTNGTDTDDIVGWDQLPAVRSGAAVVVDLDTAVALNTPSPLSILYAMDVIRPALEAAAET